MAEGEESRHINLILGLDGGERWLEIVVLVWQAESVRTDINRIARGVLFVGTDGRSEQPATQTAGLGHEGDQFVAGGAGLDLRKLRSDRLDAGFFDQLFVHVGGVIGTDFRVRFVRMLDRVFQNAMDAGFG